MVSNRNSIVNDTITTLHLSTNLNQPWNFNSVNIQRCDELQIFIFRHAWKYTYTYCYKKWREVQDSNLFVWIFHERYMDKNSARMTQVQENMYT